MNTILTIAANELRRLFLSPFAWIILASVQFLLAIFFYLFLSEFMEPTPWYAGRGLTEVVVVRLLQVTGYVLLLISPFITMRLFSDEIRNGTIKLLLSSPVSITELVMGKYLGAMMFFLVLLFLITLMPLSLMAGARLDPGLFASGLVALVLLSSAFASIGMFVSSLSKSPPLAAISSFIINFLLFWIADSEYIDAIANYLSLQKHFISLLSGAFSSIDIVYYLLITTMFIAMSIWRLDSLRTHQ